MNKILKNKKVLGLYLIAIGVLFLLNTLFQLKLVYGFLGLTILLSIHLIVKSVSNKEKNGKYFLSGTNLMILPVFIMVYVFFLKGTEYELLRIWPVIPLASGLSFILYKIIIDKDNTGLYISGVFISSISIVLLFYSFYRFSNFKKFLFILIPCLVVYLGIYLFSDNNTRESKNNDEE